MERCVHKGSGPTGNWEIHVSSVSSVSVTVWWGRDADIIKAETESHKPTITKPYIHHHQPSPCILLKVKLKLLGHENSVCIVLLFGKTNNSCSLRGGGD